MLVSFVVCATLFALLPAPATAVEPETVLPSAYSVTIDASSRTAEVTFALALSEVSSYPVTITAVGGAVEEQLWQGSLSAGVYRIRLPITKISSGRLKIVLKTKIVNRRNAGSDSFLVYQTWEGSL